MRRMVKCGWGLSVALAMAATARAQWTPVNGVTSASQQGSSTVIAMKMGAMRLTACNDAVVHVEYSPTGKFPQPTPFIVTKPCGSQPAAAGQPGSSVALSLDNSDPKTLRLATRKLRIEITRATAVTKFSDASGQKLFEIDDMDMRLAVVNGENTYHSDLFSNLWDSTEAFYGLGQHQSGVWNYHGEDIDLLQDNTNISIPFFVSTRGYGILWNNGGRSRFNNRFPHALHLSSRIADSIDFYFMYGPRFDTIIASYRDFTGAAPLFGRWAYGFWQCKNRYASQQEILGVAHKYRELHIPVDNIVQDWFWWKQMGDPVFNSNYPDPKGMIEDLHQNHFHIMFSFWPNFNAGTSVYQEMDRLGYFIAKANAGTSDVHPVDQALYDPFNAGARKYYWGLLNRGLFRIGADAWWLDTDEPETEARQLGILEDHHVALGDGARYADMFPLMHTTGVYQGQRGVTDQKRVFILSRSAFAGAQRNSIASWSGDVESNWASFARQIPAGLNFELSGMPYWTTDIGGFILGHPDDPAYQELFVRWFEYGSFCPVFRVHGTRAPNVNELWSYGPAAQKILTDYDRLRYRLMPYIYSVAWMTTSQGYTPMRALVMDWPSDVRAQNVGDEFMFGPAIFVAPVTQPGATSREVYLPAGKWYDFWNGHEVDGAATVDAPAPLDEMPLGVRAGSILPMGPEMEYTSQKPEDPIELRVYPGADGAFNLYEDDGNTYDYEKGEYAVIPMRWDDANHTLIIGPRQGKFPGMLESRTFHIVFVSENHGAGIDATAQPDKIVTYAGQSLTVTE